MDVSTLLCCFVFVPGEFVPSHYSPPIHIKENFDPESQELSAKSAPRETVHRREVTEEDTQEVWRNITLTQYVACFETHRTVDNQYF